jgi:hypothetical protein
MVKMYQSQSAVQTGVSITPRMKGISCLERTTVYVHDISGEKYECSINRDTTVHDVLFKIANEKSKNVNDCLLLQDTSILLELNKKIRSITEEEGPLELTLVIIPGLSEAKETIRYYPNQFKDLNEEIRGNEIVALIAVKSNPLLFTDISEALQNDVTFIKKAVSVNNKVFQYIPKEKKDNKEFVNELKDIQPNTYPYIHLY